MNLYTLQKNIAHALNNPKANPSGICAQPPLSAQQRLSIYRNSITAALIRVLTDTYSICRQLTGDDFFNAMAEVYIAQTPSYTPDIDEYGEDLPQFIRVSPQASSLPYLGDVAALEWAWRKALRAVDYSPLNTAALAQLSPENYPQVIFKTPPASTLLKSEYPIHRIWKFHQPDYQGEPEVDLSSGGVNLFIWQQAGQVQLEEITQEECLLLSALQENLSLEKILSRFSAHDMATNIVPLLEKFTKQQWLTDFELAQ